MVPLAASQRRVLVVEDEPDVASLIKHTLEQSPDLRVELVVSGDAALKARVLGWFAQ